LPVTRRGSEGARFATFGALMLAVVVLAWVMFGLGGGYEVRLTLQNAAQLVKGDEVKVGGVPVGKVTDIALSPRGLAVVRISVDEDDLAPLHAGTKATVRSTSLSGIANRYVALAPGPNNRREIPNGSFIPTEDTQNEVDLDAVLNTLDPATQRDLRTGIRASSRLFSGAERQANAGLEALNPALAQGAATASELASDQALLERFIVESADVVGQVSARPAELEELIANALGATSAIASQTASLDSVLAQLPPTLRRTNTTLVNLRALLRDVHPVVREARPAAPLLSRFLVRLRPVAARARPLIARTSRLIDRPGRLDLLGVLRGLIAVEQQAVPAFNSTVKVVNDALPVVREARPYAPDLVGGLLNGFGGTTGGYYDANGHYARISFQGSVYSLTNLPTLVPLPLSQQGLTGYRKGVDRRCPGAGTQTGRDHSNPYTAEPQIHCDKADNPQ
jgi:phospholipid/cholesterol/gamma-HCH transport system substrate-binding protein